MHPDLEASARTVTGAPTPEAIFGALPSDTSQALRELTTAYRKLATMLHPDRYPDPADQAEATRIFSRLNALKAEAEQAIAAGTYGKPRSAAAPTPGPVYPLRVSTKTAEYVVTGLLAAGDIADIYFCEDPDVVLKVARSAGDNDLLANEATVLGKLYPPAQPSVDYYRYLPKLLDSFMLRARGGAPRKVNVLRRVPQHISLVQIMAHFQDGLDYRDVAWMWKRCLSALGFIHHEGFVHGAVIPTNILVDPIGHGAKLLDWCYAVSPGNKVRAMIADAEEFYAPEIPGKREVGPSTDIYMMTKCMVGLLGGDPASGALGASVPAPIRRFAAGCMIMAPTRRPDDAWALQEELDELLRQLVGKPQYRPLAIPV